MKTKKKIVISLFLLLITYGTSSAQEKTTNSAYISFYSELDAIEAENFNVTSRLNPETGAILFSVPIKSFEFENEMMQEHFNQEDVMDSNKFLTSTFKGHIENFESLNFNKNGIYTVTVKGDLTIKGVVQQTTQSGSLIMDNQIITLELTIDLDRFLWGIRAKEGDVSQILQLQVESIYK